MLPEEMRRGYFDAISRIVRLINAGISTWEGDFCLIGRKRQRK
jgi:hypothetical protein